MLFQDLIVKLQGYWAGVGCTILQPYDMEVGAGTFHPATSLRCLSDNPWNVAYVQPSRRPTDGRYGENPNRNQYYYQFQVILKPSPDNAQKLCLESLGAIGIDTRKHDCRFIEDDWQNPSIGAAGLGWELWCDGMEVLQFTYMQQIGSVEIQPVPCELTYGLERIAMYIQGVDHIMDIQYSKDKKYSDIFLDAEKQQCTYNFEYADVQMLEQHFEDYQKESQKLIDQNLVIPAYEYCIKASHVFNLLEARGVFSVTQRAAYVAKIRQLSKDCCVKWVNLSKAQAK